MVRCGPGCKLVWGEPAEARVWSAQIVVSPPVLDDLTSVAIAVEAFVPQAPLEGLHEAIPHRLARHDVPPFDTILLLPFEHGVRSEFGSVVADHYRRIAATLGDRIQRPRHALAGDRVIDLGRQTFPAEVVDDTQYAEAAAIDQCVRDKVEAPALVDGRRASLPSPVPSVAMELPPVSLDALALQTNLKAVTFQGQLNLIAMAFARLKACLRAAAARTFEQLWNAIGDICDHRSPKNAGTISTPPAMRPTKCPML